jgi:hypothetical protein
MAWSAHFVGNRRLVFCPACDRYTGPVEECPYCGVESPCSGILRAVRRGALFLAVAGLGVLLAAAARTPRPPVRLCEIGPEHHSSRVATAGSVTRAPTVRRRNGRAYFVSVSLRDGAARLTATACGRTAAQMESEGLVPARGEEVILGGTVHVTPGLVPNLRMDSPHDMTRITR